MPREEQIRSHSVSLHPQRRALNVTDFGAEAVTQPTANETRVTATFVACLLRELFSSLFYSRPFYAFQ